MRSGRSRLAVLVMAMLTALPAWAAAHAFPDGGWKAFHCGSHVMTDPFQDAAGAFGDRDLVGDLNAPTGFHAFDAEDAYLRMRLDQDPRPDGGVNPHAWGFLFDLDEDASTYEALVRVEGDAGIVGLYRNKQTTTPNDPAEEPDSLVHAYTIADATRTLVAPGSNNGGDADYFLDVAIPFKDLADVGITGNTPFRVWVATSRGPEVLDGDLACDDGSGVDDGHRLSASVTQTELFWDLSVGAGNGDGTGSEDDPNAVRLTGGSGCSATEGPFSLTALLLVVAALAMRRGSR